MLAACPLCQHSQFDLILRIDATPVHQHVTGATEAEARACPRGDMALTLCRACGFVFNAAYEPDRLRYAAGYENSQNCSPVFQSYVDDLVADVGRRYDLAGRTVVEIGCGQGTFLRTLADRTGCRGVGFDPSYDSTASPGHPRCTFVPSAYDPAYADAAGDVLCARHVIEHLSQPVDLLRDIRRAMEHRSGVVWMETPRFEWILERRAFWDIFYEHCSYFSMPVLAALFGNQGFHVTSHRATFAGQYQWIEARPSAEAVEAVSPPAAGMIRQAGEFAAAWTRWRDEWQRKVRQLAAVGPCVLWGAGAKGVTFLNHLDLDATVVSAVVDLNPRKQARFIPGTGQRIVGPDAVRAMGVRTVLVANSNYSSEIRDTLTIEECDADVLTLEEA
jgi:SAM-dependent methyltransferase